MSRSRGRRVRLRGVEVESASDATEAGVPGAGDAEAELAVEAAIEGNAEGGTVPPLRIAARKASGELRDQAHGSVRSKTTGESEADGGAHVGGGEELLLQRRQRGVQRVPAEPGRSAQVQRGERAKRTPS